MSTSTALCGCVSVCSVFNQQEKVALESNGGHGCQEVLPDRLVHPWRGSMVCDQASSILPGACQKHGLRGGSLTLPFSGWVTPGKLLTSLSLSPLNEKWAWTRTRSEPLRTSTLGSFLETAGSAWNLLTPASLGSDTQCCALPALVCAQGGKTGCQDHHKDSRDNACKLSVLGYVLNR